MNILINKVDLIDILQKNRQKHKLDYEKAKGAYAKTAEELLNKLLEKVRSGKVIRQYLELPEIQNHDNDYDRAIQMLELDVRDNIPLEQNEFKNYVQDQWSWTEDFNTTNSMYLSSTINM